MSKEGVFTKGTLEGIVVSDRMKGTIVVNVACKVLHPLYRKYVVRSRRYKVHDRKEVAHIGDRVCIGKSRPLSRDKCFSLLDIIECVR